MRLVERLVHLTTTRAAAAVVALLAVAAPVAAQTQIELAPETATVRAGKWVVTTGYAVRAT